MAQDSSAPRHGRHSAGRHAAPRTEPLDETRETPAAREATDFVEPVATEAATATEPSQTPQASAGHAAIPLTVPTVPAASLPEEDQDLQMEDAPTPIGVNPQETGSFARISAEEGARVTTRANASDTAAFRAASARPVEAVRMSSAGRPHVERRQIEVETNGRVFAVLGAAALVVVVVVGWLLIRALGSVGEAQEKAVVEQTQAAWDEGIEYRGNTYRIEERGADSYALTSVSEGQNEPSVVCELSGKPVALILYNTVFVMPENLPNGTWDLIAHPLGGGSMTQQVTDGDGKPIVNQGEIASATLVGETIQIETVAGESFTVSLE